MDIKIGEDFFAMDEEQTKTTKGIYNDKIIKCIVAPYHTYAQLEKVVPFTKTTYLFPEREMSADQCRSLVSMIVASPVTEEFRIVTVNQNIIQDMVGVNVRVLTEQGELVYTGTKTFMANIHDIRYNLLENEDHQISKKAKEEAKDKINALIDKVQPGVAAITAAEADELKAQIGIIGEPIIRNKMMEMFYDNVTTK